MALKKTKTTNNAAENSLLVTNKEIISEYNINITIGAADAAVVYGVGYPFAFNDVTGQHAPWTAPDPTVLTIDLGQSTAATGGNFDVTVNDFKIEDFAFDATVAEVDALFKTAGYDVTTELASDIYTITFDGQPEIEVLPTVVGDVSDLTGATGEATSTADGTGTAGTDRIRGFIHPEQAQTGITTGDVALVVLTGTDTVCHATQATGHGLTTGMSLTMSGATESNLNVTASITVVDDYNYTYAVSAVSGGTEDSGSYTTTNDQMTVMMVKGVIAASVPEAFIDSSDLTAFRTALKNGLIGDGIVVQGLVGRH